jgi:uncharacterized membrane protein YfcA
MREETIMADIRLPSERHYRHHRRQWQIHLLFCAVMAIGTVAAVLVPGDNPGFVLWPAGVVLILMVGAGVMMRARGGKAYDAESKRIRHDEWITSSMRISSRDALLAVIFAQGPLMFFMAYVPPEPSVVGMGMMTTALGCGAFAWSYLYRTRASADG